MTRPPIFEKATGTSETFERDWIRNDGCTIKSHHDKEHNNRNVGGLVTASHGGASTSAFTLEMWGCHDDLAGSNEPRSCAHDRTGERRCPTSIQYVMNSHDDNVQGAGRGRATVAHMVLHFPKAMLQATMAGGAAAAATVPKVKPAAE